MVSTSQYCHSGHIKDALVESHSTFFLCLILIFLTRSSFVSLLIVYLLFMTSGCREQCFRVLNLSIIANIPIESQLLSPQAETAKMVLPHINECPTFPPLNMIFFHIRTNFPDPSIFTSGPIPLLCAHSKTLPRCRISLSIPPYLNDHRLLSNHI